MFFYLLTPFMLATALFLKKNQEPVFQTESFIKKVEPFSDYNIELFNEYVKNLKLYETTKVVEYLNDAVSNIKELSLHSIDDFENVELTDVSNELKHFTNN
jgi:hypothetical protein